jgi:hypothetical protein
MLNYFYLYFFTQEFQICQIFVSCQSPLIFDEGLFSNIKFSIKTLSNVYFFGQPRNGRESLNGIKLLTQEFNSTQTLFRRFLNPVKPI